MNNIQQECYTFHVSGHKDFTEGFERLLIDNNIAYTKPDAEAHFEPRICRRNNNGRIVKERRTFAIPYESLVTIAISTCVPKIIDKICEWYKAKKQKDDKIIIETEYEFIEVNAKRITKVKLTKRKRTRQN